MKDARVVIWTNPTTHDTGTTTNNGPTIDLFLSGAMAGGTSGGTGEGHGIGAVILQTNATGTAQVSNWYWEHSTDDSTWYRAKHIGTNTLSTASAVYRRKTSFMTENRYARLSCDNTLTGTSTSKAYPEDYGTTKAGTQPFA